jgi:LysM repeat protein
MDRIEKVLVFVVVATIVVIVTLALSNTGDDGTSDGTGDATTSRDDIGTAREDNPLVADLGPPVIPTPHGAGDPAGIAPDPAVPAPPADPAFGEDLTGLEDLPGPAPTATPAPPPSRPAPAPERTYVVKPNDNLWKIAQKFYDDGKYWKRIRDANPGKVDANDGVKPNTTLVVPRIDRAAAAKPKVTIVVPNGQNASRGYRVVTLQKGEWLYKVLRRENMTSRKKDVLRLNGLTEAQARDLKPGYELKLPVD